MWWNLQNRVCGKSKNILSCLLTKCQTVYLRCENRVYAFGKKKRRIYAILGALNRCICLIYSEVYERISLK